MASKIETNNIDGTYPVAGQDNSSQGMRDNFSAIKTNFQEAKTEIEDLQTNKASTNAESDFTDNIIKRAVLLSSEWRKIVENYEENCQGRGRQRLPES